MIIFVDLSNKSFITLFHANVFPLLHFFSQIFMKIWKCPNFGVESSKFVLVFRFFIFIFIFALISQNHSKNFFPRFSWKLLQMLILGWWVQKLCSFSKKNFHLHLHFCLNYSNIRQKTVIFFFSQIFMKIRLKPNWVNFFFSDFYKNLYYDLILGWRVQKSRSFS